MNGSLNMTHLALFFSRYVNGVAMRHGQISKGMFPGYPIASITNGVHAERWVARPFAAVYDQHILDWRQQNENLRYAVGIWLHEIQNAHRECKRTLLREIAERTGQEWSEAAFTIGFARRATPYKRAEMLLWDLDRLRGIARATPLQIVYAGKAHPHDGAGKEIIAHIVAKARALGNTLPLVYLEDYDIALAQKLCSGVDLWLNTPQKPEEASGTSGMKAALNGVPSLSVLDGFWIEGHVEGVTGWSIGETWEPEADPNAEAGMLYDKLENIAKLFFGHPDGYAKVRRHAIALNGSFFNAQRMIEQYAESAYRLRPGAHS
jgi:starch phosphorylase